MRRAFNRFAANAEGSAAIEYSLIVAGIALGMLMALLSFSDQLQGIYAGIEAGVASLSGL
jgi:Flp pilus assembly pilin Flp